MQQRNRLLADDVRDARAVRGVRADHGGDGRRHRGGPRRGRRRTGGPRFGARRDAGSRQPSSRGPSSRWSARSRRSLPAGPPSKSRTTTSRCWAASASATAPPAARWTARTGPIWSSGTAPRSMPAKVCSTGEQKALLIGLVLAHCDVVRQRQEGAAPILLLDEIAAHLDPSRRAALFDELVALGTQAWMTGTDPEAFSGLAERAQFFVSRGPDRRRALTPADAAEQPCKALKYQGFFHRFESSFCVLLRAPLGVSFAPAKNPPKRTSENEPGQWPPRRPQ